MNAIAIHSIDEENKSRPTLSEVSLCVVVPDRLCAVLGHIVCVPLWECGYYVSCCSASSPSNHCHDGFILQGILASVVVPAPDGDNHAGEEARSQAQLQRIQVQLQDRDVGDAAEDTASSFVLESRVST